MFFPAHKVRHACARNLDDPPTFKKAVRDLIGTARVSPDYPLMLRHFLRRLPSAEDQGKILRRFRRIAERRHATIRGFAWWDLMAGERVLFARVTRAAKTGRKTTVTVAFVWKKSEKGSASVAAKSLAKTGWVRDIGIPEGWRYEFEAPTYQTVKAQFQRWLATPLTIHP